MSADKQQEIPEFRSEVIYLYQYQLKKKEKKKDQHQLGSTSHMV